jgi:hypothetical protein
MATYGELIDSNVNFDKLPAYTFFLEYFNNPLLKFFKQTPDHHVIYAAKVRSQLSRQKRYLFALIKKHPKQNISEFPSEIYLRDLQWSCLQTRTLDDEYNLPLFTYSSKPDTHLITLNKKEDSRYIYSCDDFPIQVILLTSKTQMKPYSDRGTLSLALETYHCLVHI